jgi:uncharacterized protein
VVKTALITGASSGIGYELAFLFANDRYNLVLVGRNAVVLEKLAADLAERHGIQALPIPVDLAQPGAAQTIFNLVEREKLHIDVLVNNAGFALNGSFANLDLQGQLNEIQVNITALTHLTRLYLPAMIARKFGGVLNVASTAAFVPGPMMAVYYATKAYVLSFTEALANEVADDGIIVSCLCPGATLTDFQKRAGLQAKKLFTGPTVMDAATVARIGFDGFKKRKRVVVTGAFNQLAVFLSRFVPRQMSASVTRGLQE